MPMNYGQYELHGFDLIVYFLGEKKKRNFVEMKTERIQEDKRTRDPLYKNKNKQEKILTMKHSFSIFRYI